MMTRLGYAIRSSVPSLSGRDAMTLTLAQARTILDKTLAAGREKKFKPLGVAVVDSRGALRAYAEEDGNPILRSKIASGKASGRSPSARDRGGCIRSAWSARTWRRRWSR